MISKETFLKALENYRSVCADQLISDSNLRIRQGNFEYIFRADNVVYLGDGTEFLTLTFDDDWTSHGTAQVVSNSVSLDGSSWLSYGQLELGGSDFQIEARVLESADDMIQRRKIFELYTSAELNISLYSSGAGKNLDLFVNCDGTFDTYNEPAILGREYHFVLKYRAETGQLTLDIDGVQVYSLVVSGLNQRRTFEQVLVGSSAYHENANWLGTISDFKIYDGFAEV